MPLSLPQILFSKSVKFDSLHEYKPKEQTYVNGKSRYKIIVFRMKNIVMLKFIKIK